MTRAKDLKDSGELAGAIDDYFANALVHEDEDLKAARARIDAAQLPPISVTPLHGKFLNLMVKVTGAKRILELGALGGYSTIWMAKALPAGGRIISLEIRDICVEIAQQNAANAGLQDKIDVRFGPALDLMDKMEEAGEGPFDLIFIDADKPNYHRYFTRVLDFVRSGSVIITDNVVLGGEVLDEDSENHSVRAMRKMIEAMAAEDRIEATAIQTAGLKGHDGFALIRVK